MSEIRILTFLELRSLYGINKFRYTKDTKAKNRYKLLAVVWIFIICMVFSYVGGMAYGFSYMGIHKIVPMYLTFLATLLIFVFDIFKAGNKILEQNGYDILASMPIKPSSIVISRFIAMYVEDLILSLVIMFPGLIVYGICNGPGVSFYIVSLIGVLFVPAIPLVISTMLGTLIMAISSRLKNKSIVNTILMIGLMMAIFIGIYGIEDFTNGFNIEKISEVAMSLADFVGKIYIPAIWLSNAILDCNILQLVAFVTLSMVVIILLICFVSKKFNIIVRRLMNFTAKHDYKIGKIESRNLTKALYVREAKRYFSSSIYVTNTIIGPIIGAVMSIALCVVGIDTIKGVVSFNIDITSIIPFFVAGIFCMMTSSSCSLSMEGKQFWIIKSMPIRAKELFDSKILLNLSLILPFYVVSQIALIIALKPDVFEFIWLIIIPALLIVFAVILGVTINIKFHSFDWEKEESVVKQSVSAMLGGFFGVFISLILGVIMLVVPRQYVDILRFFMCLIIVTCTVRLYKKNNAIKIDKL